VWLRRVDLSNTPSGAFFVGVSTLARKWLAKTTKTAVLAKMAKMTQKAWFSIIGDFWGDLSRTPSGIFFSGRPSN
jgi:hypothetical protein